MLSLLESAVHCSGGTQLLELAQNTTSTVCTLFALLMDAATSSADVSVPLRSGDVLLPI